jgi:hypothetical protein
MSSTRRVMPTSHGVSVDRKGKSGGLACFGGMGSRFLLDCGVSITLM